jgi:hypothetical protein
MNTIRTDPMRTPALVVTAMGLVGSEILTYRAGGPTQPLFLRAAFAGWVFTPFAVLLWANFVSPRWAVVRRTTVQGLALLVSAISLPIYAEWIPRPAGTARAFMFTMTAPASWLVIAGVLGLATWVSRKAPS